MANIILTNPKFFKGGESGASYVVGFDSGVNRVVRYSFEPPSIGANKVELSFLRNWTGSGTLPNTLRFFIGTDPNSHINAGVGYEYTGELARKQGTYEYYGSADIVILPNRTYYVFVFPTTQTYGWVQWSNSEGDATAETFGGAFSVVSPQTLTIGEPSTIYVTKYNEPYTHTIRYSIGTASGVICEKESVTEIPWTPSIDLARQITSSTSGLAEITIETYSGNTLIGSSPYVQFILNVPSNIVPSVTATVKDLSIGYDQFEVFTQNVSFLSVTPSAIGSYGSTIKKIQILLNGVPYSGGVVKEKGDIPLSVVVTDSRGRTAKYEKTLVFYEYYFPSVSVSASRCDEDGTANESGEFAAIKVTTKTYQVNGKNTGYVELNYGNTSEQIRITPGGEYFFTKIVSAPSVSPLAISAIVFDRMGQSPKRSMTLGVGYATMDFLSGGRGIAFGTTATRQGFECAMPAYFTGGIVAVAVSGGALSEERKTGLYRYGPFVADNPMPNYGGLLRVEASDLAIVQTAYIYASDGYYGIVATRQLLGDETEFRDWEWINPPMTLGVEYRTTERYLGKPVYTMLFSFGVLPNSSKKSVSYSSENCLTFSATGTLSYNSDALEKATTLQGFPGVSSVLGERSKVTITTENDLSGYYAHVYVKYTKSADY